MSLADELLADLEDDDVPEDESLINLEIVPDKQNLESTQRQYSSVDLLTKIIGSDELAKAIDEINFRRKNDGMR